MSDDKPIQRRRFFREGLGELLRPLIKAIEPVEKVIHHIGSLEEQAAAYQQRIEHDPYHAPPPHSPYWLRPPGALPEEQFRSTCSRCGECVRVCPAQAIKMDYHYERGDGFPYIEAAEMACVLCDGLQCMGHCPSGALVPTPKEQIRMGLAVWDEQTCSRGRGEDCTICVDKCPVGPAAIQFVDGRIQVMDPGCTGCGVCEQQCPTYPKSIKIMPASERAAHTPDGSQHG